MKLCKLVVSNPFVKNCFKQNPIKSKYKINFFFKLIYQNLQNSATKTFGLVGASYYILQCRNLIRQHATFDDSRFKYYFSQILKIICMKQIN